MENDPVATARGSDIIGLDSLHGQGLLCWPAHKGGFLQNDWPRGQFQFNQTDRVIDCHHPASETTARRFKHGGKKCSEWERMQTKKRARPNQKQTATQLEVIQHYSDDRPANDHTSK